MYRRPQVTIGSQKHIAGDHCELKVTLPATLFSARPRFTDLTSGHLNFDSASIAVGADILDLYENDRFLPIRVVSGRDAADVVTKLTDLLERVR